MPLMTPEVASLQTNYQKKVDILQKQLTDKIEEWEGILLRLQHDKRRAERKEAIGEILATLGFANLLLREPLIRFSKFLFESRTNPSKQSVFISDVQGYWDLLMHAVKDINKKFERLDRLKDNNWVMVDETAAKSTKRKSSKKNVPTSSTKNLEKQSDAETTLRNFASLLSKKEPANSGKKKFSAKNLQQTSTDYRQRQDGAENSEASTNIDQALATTSAYEESPERNLPAKNDDERISARHSKISRKDIEDEKHYSDPQQGSYGATGAVPKIKTVVEHNGILQETGESSNRSYCVPSECTCTPAFDNDKKCPCFASTEGSISSNPEQETTKDHEKTIHSNTSEKAAQGDKTIEEGS